MWITTAAVALAGICACGDDDVQPGPDAAVRENPRLVILDPPGESVGLSFAGSAALRVRYETADGEPLPDAPIEFAFDNTSADAAGGSTLSATRAMTDAEGTAQVTVVAGVERANFRVRATAPSAVPVVFFVAVSELGFAELEVTPMHEGWRAAEDYARVNVRLYPRDMLGCEQYDLAALPAPVFPPRALDGFGPSAEFRNVNAAEAYTLVAWGELSPGGVPAAQGCVTLGGSQVPASNQVHLAPVVVDRDIDAPDAIALASLFDLSPLADADAEAPWSTLGCPAGLGQLVLDASLAASGDATLVADIEAQRGAVDDDGCRPDTGADAAVDAGRDATLSDVELEALLAARAEIAAAVELRSRLAGTSHALESAAFADGAHVVPLADSDRLVVTANAISVTPAGNAALLGTHAFTLRLGDAMRDAFAALGLAPLALDDQVGALGTALAQTFSAGALTGCDAVSQLACDAAGRADDCLAAACDAALPALDAALSAWWQRANGTGLDFSLAGTVLYADADADLQADGVAGGSWDATLTIEGDASVALTGDIAELPLD